LVRMEPHAPTEVGDLPLPIAHIAWSRGRRSSSWLPPSSLRETAICQIDCGQLSSAPMSAGEPYGTRACCGSATSIRNVGRVGYRQHPDRRGIERPDAADVCHLDPV